jgi:hypothetical protein
VSEADRAALRAKNPDAILLSATSSEVVAALRETIIGFFEAAIRENRAHQLLGDLGEDHGRGDWRVKRHRAFCPQLK